VALRNFILLSGSAYILLLGALSFLGGRFWVLSCGLLHGTMTCFALAFFNHYLPPTGFCRGWEKGLKRVVLFHWCRVGVQRRIHLLSFLASGFTDGVIYRFLT